MESIFSPENKHNQTTLYCFSPPIMIATVIAEVLLALWVLFKYSKTMFGKVSTAILLLLAAFQVSEYQVCSGLSTQWWSKFGLTAITLLPVLGYYLINTITKKQIYLKVGAAIATLFVLYFIFAPWGTISSFCGGNYVVFTGPAGLYQMFGAYYFGFLVLSVWQALAGEHKTSSHTLQSVLKWIVIGYLSFMLPLAVVYSLFAPARLAVASIMCGFAVIFAFILAFEIVPKYYKHNSKKSD